MEHADLTTLTLLNTRSTHQAESLNTLLTHHGASMLNFPCLDIHPLSSTAPPNRHADIAIFVSANAVWHSLPLWPKPFAIPTIIAIGPSTKATLQQEGLSNILLPQEYTSEGLLSLPVLHHVAQRQISLFCGKDTRPLLPNTLTQRGAIVTQYACYERRCPTQPPIALETLKQQTINGIISTSKASLTNLNHLIANIPQLKDTPLIVISPAMGALARQQGWQHILMAKNPSHDAILETVIQLNP